MKIFTTLTILLFMNIANGQHWCRPGSVWKYNYDSLWIKGGVEWKYVGDSVMNGRDVQQITVTGYYFNMISNERDTVLRYKVFTYEENEIVFYKVSNSWDTLFNFGATIGDRWDFPTHLMQASCTDNGYIEVSDFGDTLLNNISLPYLKVMFHFGGGSYPSFLISRLGYSYIHIYPFPYNNFSCGSGQHEAANIMCYSDDEIGTVYGVVSQNGCNFYLDLPELMDDHQKTVTQITDLSGRICVPKPNTLLIYHYSDGSHEKKMHVEP